MNLAMAYGDEFNSNEVFAYQLREFAYDVGVNHKLVAKVLFKQSEMIIKSLAEPIVEPELLEQILKRAEHFKEIAKEIPFVSF